MADETTNERRLMEHSFLLLTGRMSFEQILETEDDLAVIFNPYKPIKVMEGDAYDCLIEYYITTEEYEKCHELTQMKQLNKLIN